MKHSKDIDKYITLLKEYNSHTNIYSEKAYDKLDFHISDSLTLATKIPNTRLTVLDIGSGSGLPSVPIAITNKNNQIIAVESKSKKSRFLELAKESLTLKNLTIINENIFEYLDKNIITPNIITAKAFGSYEKIKKIIQKTNKKNNPTLYIPISKNQFETFKTEKNNSYILEKHKENELYYLKETFTKD